MQHSDIISLNHYFFIGVAGAGMSAIAQYLAGKGKTVKGSDRLFQSSDNDGIKTKLESENIQCFLQDGSGIDASTQAVIISTAIEDTNIEIQKAKELHIPIVLRADLLAAICDSKRTIAIAGTSGKSTVTAMLFHILQESGMQPSLISGAGLCSLQKQGKIGNSFVGKSDWLLIEADESDGTLVKYQPEIGVLLSIDKDHKELDELHQIFSTFKQNTKSHFVVNQSHPLAKSYSVDKKSDYGTDTPFDAVSFKQVGFSISFNVKSVLGKDVQFTIPTIGQHNMENALACIAVCSLMNVSIEQCAYALKSYEGIYRRHQLVGVFNGITLIDDYAHNPAKIAASLKACQAVGNKLVAWFQPHGYGPTRFIRKELVQEIAATLRPTDEIWMSEIYYAGGSAVKDISARHLIQDLKALGLNAFFVEDRVELFNQLVQKLNGGEVLLMMGARDPSLEYFASDVAALLQNLK